MTDLMPIIEYSDFVSEYERLCRWFRVKTTDDQVMTVYDRAKTYPKAALTFAVDRHIDNNRPTPGGFPTTNELLNRMVEWLESNPEAKFQRMVFDPHNDWSYPLSKLWDGYRVLERRGKDAFLNFASLNRMPAQDVERVLMKYQVVSARRECEMNANLNSMVKSLFVAA